MKQKRFCCICCEYQSITLFNKAPDNIDGLSYQCKPCLNEHQREQNKKKGYFKRYYYKKKGVQYILPTPMAQVVSEASAPIQESSSAETPKTSIQLPESKPVFIVSFV